MKNINDLDAMLLNLVKNNAEKIKAKTPSNPAIKKDDEWHKENHWDELYKELTTK